MSETMKQIYDFLVEYTADHIYAPSVQEIADAAGIKSKSSVWSRLKELERNGLIQLGEKGQARCIHLIGFRLVKEEAS